jgi:hypothetical protein
MLSLNPLQQHESMSVRQSVKANTHEVRFNENEALVLGHLPSITLNLEALTLGRAFANIAGKRHNEEMDSGNVDDWGTMIAGMFEGSQYGNVRKGRKGTDLLNWRNKWSEITKVEVLFFEDPNVVIEWNKLKAAGNSETELSAWAKPQSQIAAVWKIERASQIVHTAVSFSIGQGGSEPNCVTVDILAPKSTNDPAQFYVSDLFYMLKDKSICEVESETERGWGTFVLNTITMAAAQSNAYCRLEDVSAMGFTKGVKATRLESTNSKMTHNLILIRGYGFYEGIGYFTPLGLVGIPFSDVDRAVKWQQWQLTWTHAVLTTPLNQLKGTLTGKNEVGKALHELLRKTRVLGLPPDQYIMDTLVSYLDMYLVTAQEIANKLVEQPGDLSIRDLYSRLETMNYTFLTPDMNRAIASKRLNELFHMKNNKLWDIVYLYRGWKQLYLEKYIFQAPLAAGGSAVPFHIVCKPGVGADPPTAVATPVSIISRHITTSFY